MHNRLLSQVYESGRIRKKRNEGISLPNVLDYIYWRGDLGFDAAPVNEVDKYIFSCIGKPDYTGVVPSGTESVSISEAVSGYFASHPDAGDRLGLIASAKTLPALKMLSKSKRYDSVRLSGFINRVLVEKTEQFSALTVLADGVCYVSFRGTDDSIVGWKENCELAVYDCVPAQRDALAYLEWAAESFDGPIVVCGHSKGGNLAIYAACCASEEVQARITEVLSFDGPGFQPAFLESEGYARMESRIFTLVPNKSVVGMLLGHAGTLEVIDADTVGIVGHDGFTWSVTPDAFVHAAELSDFSRIFRTAIAETLAGMDSDDRSELIEELFDMLTSTGAFMLSDFTEYSLRQSFEIAKHFRRATELKEFLFRLTEFSVKTSIEARRNERAERDGHNAAV